MSRCVSLEGKQPSLPSKPFRSNATPSETPRWSSLYIQNHNEHSSLQDDIYHNLIESPRGGDQRFLPDDQFKSLVTAKSIEVELDRAFAGTFLGASNKVVSQVIFKRCPKLFTILVLIERTTCIQDFIDEDIDDKHLPFRRDGLKFFSRSRTDLQVACTVRWKSKFIMAFSQFQWSLYAPIFTRDTTIPHYCFDDNEIMPLIFNASGDPTQIRRGGFSEVFEVKIHPAHERFSWDSKSSMVGRDLLTYCSSFAHLSTESEPVFRHQKIKLYGQGRVRSRSCYAQALHWRPSTPTSCPTFIHLRTQASLSFGFSLRQVQFESLLERNTSPRFFAADCWLVLAPD